MGHIPKHQPARRELFGILRAGIAASLTPIVWGQGKGKGHEKSAAQSRVRPVFSPQERSSIQAYVRDTPGFLPAGVRALPPGLAKNVQRGKPLPPGWRKKMAVFPPGLERGLPALPPGYRRVVVDRWAFIIAQSTNTVLDIIDLIQDR